MHIRSVFVAVVCAAPNLSVADNFDLPGTPGTLLAVVDGAVLLHSALANCAPDTLPQPDDTKWPAFEAAVMATLSANNLPESLVAEVSARFNAPVSPVDCAAASPLLDRIPPSFAEATWNQLFHDAFEMMNYPLRDPPDQAVLEAVFNEVQTESRRWAPILKCAAVSDFRESFAILARKWNEQTGHLEEAMSAAGFSSDNIDLVLIGARLDQMLPSPDTDRLALLQSCLSDEDWNETRRFGVKTMPLADAIALLPGG